MKTIEDDSEEHMSVETCGKILVSQFENNDVDSDAMPLNMRGYHPWHVSIRPNEINGSSAHHCSGVLVSNKHVITAAHCLKNYHHNDFFLRFGDHLTDVKEIYEEDVTIDKWILHSDFQRTLAGKDIAVIVLKSPITFNKFIRSICLPSNKDKHISELNHCYISGWDLKNVPSKYNV